MRPKAAQIGRAYGLPKVHKPFKHLPKFRTIIDTINTPYHGIGKFLTSLLNPLAQNEYVVKDSFEAAAKINSISFDEISDEYTFVSFDVESLFTNIPLKKTIEIILNRVYSEKKISTTLSKRSLEKLLLDACTKTAFSFNKKLYEQIDGVSMGSPLGPLMTNVIMTELERVVVNDLFKKEYLKFYIRFMDDMLVLMKKSDVPIVLQAPNGFHKNLNFTVDTFENKKVHFLDLLIDRNTTDIFYKDIHTGQYTNYNSFMP